MNIVEVTMPDGYGLPLDEFAEYLKLSIDMTGKVRQDQVLSIALGAAISEIETKTRKSLIARHFVVSLSNIGAQSVLVKSDNVRRVVSLDAMNYDTVPMDASALTISVERDGIYVTNTGPVIPSLNIEFQTGPKTWLENSSDLRLASFILAAYYHDSHLSGENPDSENLIWPKQITQLIQKYRNIRVWRGAE